MDKRRYNKREKYPALNPRFQTIVRRELIDYDYIDKLNDEEKDFLNRFTEETIVTNFHHPGETLINDVEQRRALYRANNQRMKDVINVAKKSDSLRVVDTKEIMREITGSIGNVENQENYLLELIRLKRSGELGKKDD